MAKARFKSKTTSVQLSLFDINQYERSRSNYDIEDGYEVDFSLLRLVSESKVQLVSESIVQFVSESIVEPDFNFDSLTNDSLTKFQPCGTVGKYRSGGNTRGGGEYYRFSYRDGKQVKHIHIPGGCSSNSVATSRAAKVRCAIAIGTSTVQVLELIRSFTRNPK